MKLRLTSTSLDFYVDVHLRDFGRRWIAVADIAGENEIGLGVTAREALVGSLASLGAEATFRLMADGRRDMGITNV